jgi:UDP-4-amino-4,6-dideoxy-N-acetyl-beta-L-altrosamine N-acetyltransferase
MAFTRFGITLDRLEYRDLEMVRQWRNSDWVRPFMRFQEIVGPADQSRWFEGLDAARDWYFCARLDARPFGLFHVKAIDWVARMGEAGGFVGDPRLVGRPESACATLALMDFAFCVLELRALEAQYRISLRNVMRFNEQLGYEILHDDGVFVRARVTGDGYFRAASAFRTAAARSAERPFASALAPVGAPGGLESPDADPSATFDK